MTTPASNNRFKGVSFQPQATPSTPASGDGRLFLDTADGLLKWIDDAGTVTEVALGSAGLSDPMTTRGDIIIRNASNATARLGIGSSGKVLTSDGTDISWQTPSAGAMATDALWDAAGDLAVGTGANTGAKLSVGSAGQVLGIASGTPAWQGGGLVLLEQHTANNSAGTLSFTSCISSTYDMYMITITSLTPASDCIPYLKVSTNGGSSYDNSANYFWTNDHQAFGSNTIAGTNQSSQTAGMTLFGDASVGIDSTGLPALNMVVYMYDPLNTTNHKWFEGSGTARYSGGGGTTSYSHRFAGCWTQTTAVNAFQIATSTGNWTLGTVRVYGLTK